MNIAAVISLSFVTASDIGSTWPIAERDALVEIEAAAQGKSVSIDDFGDSDDWSATASPLLPEAARHRIRDVVPFFALPFDIPDKDGNVLYPKGFTFNPLEHLTLPGALWIVREHHIDWAFERADVGDMVILSGGNALKESNRRGMPVYVLQDALAKRLDLAVAPSRVWQDGAVLKVEEFLIADPSTPTKAGDRDGADRGGGQ